MTYIDAGVEKKEDGLLFKRSKEEGKSLVRKRRVGMLGRKQVEGQKGRIWSTWRKSEAERHGCCGRGG